MVSQNGNQTLLSLISEWEPDLFSFISEWEPDPFSLISEWEPDLSRSQNGNQTLSAWFQNGNQTYLDLRMGTRPFHLDLRSGTWCHFHLLLMGLKCMEKERVISTEQHTQWAVQMARSLADCAERSHHSHQQTHASSVSVQTSPSPARQETLRSLTMRDPILKVCNTFKQKIGLQRQ